MMRFGMRATTYPQRSQRGRNETCFDPHCPEKIHRLNKDHQIQDSVIAADGCYLHYAHASCIIDV